MSRPAAVHRARTLVRSLPALSLVVAAAGCSSEIRDRSRCAAPDDCFEGEACVAGVCVPGGPDAGHDAGEPDAGGPPSGLHCKAGPPRLDDGFDLDGGWHTSVPDRFSVREADGEVRWSVDRTAVATLWRELEPMRAGVYLEARLRLDSATQNCWATVALARRVSGGAPAPPYLGVRIGVLTGEQTVPPGGVTYVGQELRTASGRRSIASEVSTCEGCVVVEAKTWYDVRLEVRPDGGWAVAVREGEQQVGRLAGKLDGALAPLGAVVFGNWWTDDWPACEGAVGDLKVGPLDCLPEDERLPPLARRLELSGPAAADGAAAVAGRPLDVPLVLGGDPATSLLLLDFSGDAVRDLGPSAREVRDEGTGPAPGLHGEENGGRELRGSHLTVAHSPDLDVPAFTAAAWLRLGDFTEQEDTRFVLDYGGTVYTVWRLAVGAPGMDIAGLPYFLVADTPLYLTATSRVDDGEWHHLAVVVDAAAKHGSLWVDGRPEAMGSGLQWPFPNQPPERTIRVGAANREVTTPESYLQGVVDEVVVVPRALRAAELEHLAATRAEWGARLDTASYPRRRVADDFPRARSAWEDLRVTSQVPGGQPVQLPFEVLPAGPPRVRLLAGTLPPNGARYPTYRVHFGDAVAAPSPLRAAGGLLDGSAGYVGWWRFDDAAGDVAADTSAGYAPARPAEGGSLRWAPGAAGTALDLREGGAPAVAEGLDFLGPGLTGTLELAVRLEPSLDEHVLLDGLQGQAQADTGFALLWRGGSAELVGRFASASGGMVEEVLASGVPTGRFVSLAVVVDVDAVVTWIDGVEATRHPLAEPLRLATEELGLGGPSRGNAKALPGLLDEVRVLARPAAPEELLGSAGLRATPGELEGG